MQISRLVCFSVCVSMHLVGEMLGGMMVDVFNR